MDYPFWNIAIGGPSLMALVAITHVIVAHYAIGGGLVIAVSETLAVRRGDHEMRELARRSSLVLILVSTVFGAISGVGIWVVAGLISPYAITALIRNYVWGWAIEWVFFIVEIVAALVYYATWDRVSKRVHVTIAWIYFVAAYLSLVIINGIITFMLTPGDWLETGAFWDGFFNPTYWPSLVLRTGIALIMATAFMLIPATRAAADARPRLARYLGLWLVAGALIAYGGYRWWEAALPESVQALFLGSSPLLDTLATTRHFLLWSLAAALGITLVFLVLLPKTARLPVAIVVMLGGFAFFGGYERLREGVRKPFLIHDFMFSNGIRVDEISELNEDGFLSRAGWTELEAGEDPTGIELGRAIFRGQCASCHTLDGYQGIKPLLTDDPDMTMGVLFALWEQGEAFTSADPGEGVDKTELDYPFMPPFVGTEEEMTALAAYLNSLVNSGTDVAMKGEQ
jgi:mono/diheme cytochrome c family protein